MKYSVLREHQGDQFYRAGDTRTADETMVGHLVKAGVLAPLPEGKSAETVSNKAERVPANKAEKVPANKGAE